jgi:hypothetical protein
LKGRGFSRADKSFILSFREATLSGEDNEQSAFFGILLSCAVTPLTFLSFRTGFSPLGICF